MREALRVAKYDKVRDLLADPMYGLHLREWGTAGFCLSPQRRDGAVRDASGGVSSCSFKLATFLCHATPRTMIGLQRCTPSGDTVSVS